MSLFVVDASVGVKWLFPEPLAAEATRLRDPSHQLHVPAFFEIELANILWKKLRRSLLTRVQADLILAQIPLLPLVRHSDAPLLPSAFDLADRTQRTVYDCLYLALAVHVGGQMVTADERFVNGLAGTPWAASVMRLHDVP